MSALVYLILLVVIGMWMITDAWFSLSVHWKRDGQTFWKDQIIRIVRLFFGLLLIFMAYVFGNTVLRV